MLSKPLPATQTEERLKQRKAMHSFMALLAERSEGLRPFQRQKKAWSS
jgi:hypothetical protein